MSARKPRGANRKPFGQQFHFTVITDVLFGLPPSEGDHPSDFTVAEGLGISGTNMNCEI